jgi:hypothetical protein
MAFYKLDKDVLLKAETTVHAPGYTLRASEYTPEATLPDGWTWAESDDEARSILGLEPIIKQNIRSATRFQVRAALLQRGMLDAVDTFVEANGDALTKLAWREGNGFSPDDPVVRQMALAFGLTDADVEDLFHIARNISL